MKYIFVIFMTLNSVFAQTTYSTWITSENVKWCDLPTVSRGEPSYQDHTILVDFMGKVLRLRTFDQFDGFDGSCESHRSALLEEISNFERKMEISLLERPSDSNRCLFIIESEILGVSYSGAIRKC
jgi:hypothetical protein